jgi:hypothetical protein
MKEKKKVNQTWNKWKGTHRLMFKDCFKNKEDYVLNEIFIENLLTKQSSEIIRDLSQFFEIRLIEEILKRNNK